MRKSWQGLAFVSVVAAAALSATALYGQGMHKRGGSMMDRGGMMGHGGMMGQTSRMMDHCSQMMGATGGGSGKPNEQWQKETPRTPPKKG